MAKRRANEPAYTKTMLVAHLMMLAFTLGRTPTRADIDEADGPCGDVFYKYFGSLQDACEAAGLEARPRGHHGHIKTDVMTVDARHLTGGESTSLKLLAQAWDEFVQLPAAHPDDVEEFRRAIHAAQNIILARPTWRIHNMHD